MQLWKIKVENVALPNWNRFEIEFEYAALENLNGFEIEFEDVAMKIWTWECSFAELK